MGVDAKCQGIAGESCEMLGEHMGVQSARQGNTLECGDSARKMQGNARGTYESGCKELDQCRRSYGSGCKVPGDSRVISR